jgi:hypothetical protein
LVLIGFVFSASSKGEILHNSLAYNYLGSFQTSKNWLCFFNSGTQSTARGTQYEQIGFVFSNLLTAESAKTAENKEYIQKLCDLGAPGGKTQIGFVLQTSFAVHGTLSVRTPEENAERINWVCFFKQGHSHRALSQKRE